MSITTAFAVEGMSCGHCEKTVSAGLSAIPGITDVSADAKAGQVTVASEGEVDEGLIRSAVDRAGFALVHRI
ncbi:heavy-metal-associated domain-containing protein [Kitasatospora sp. NPDC058218]|uniref:heavy-metal-associated domain-containing protein n=1 Tax=Kitasatospora sp. NPDC058218 TaxID=3346385 RepID=UPI0036D7AF15